MTAFEPLAHGQAIPPRRLSLPWSANRVIRLALGLFVVVGGVWALGFLGFAPLELFRGAQRSTYLERALPPRWGGEFALSMQALWRTVLIAAAGTGLAAIIAFPIGLLAAGNLSPHPIARSLARGIIVFCRATPEIVLAVVFVLVVSIGERPGVMALAIHSVGMLGKLLADRLEEVDEKPREAALAAGGARWQAVFNAALPQVVPSYISTIVYRFDINLRAATVVGLVGGGGIGQLLQGNLQNPNRYRVGWAQALSLAAVILIVDFLSTRLREALAGVERRSLREMRSDEVVAEKSRSLRPPWTRDRIVTMSATMGMLAAWMFAMWSIRLGPQHIMEMLWGAARELPTYLPPSFTGVSYQAGRGELLLDSSAYVAALVDTFAIAAGASFLALVLATPLAFLIARSTTPWPPLAQGVRTCLAALRALPDIALVLFFVSLIGLQSPFPAAAALALGIFAFMAKLIADDLDGLGSGPQEAVRSSGATHRQEVVAAVLPSAMPMLVGHALYALDIALRGTVLLGIFTGIGIGWVFTQTNFIQPPYPAIAACVLTIYIAVIFIETISVAIRKYLL